MSKADKKRTALIILFLLGLAVMGPVSYSNGKVVAEVELFDRYFSAKIDLVPIMDVVLKDNTVLKVIAKEALRSVEVRDAHIKDQRNVIAGQDKMIGDMADEILELENRPPEIVEVEKVVEVEKIVEVERVVYVEVPTPVYSVERPEFTEWDTSGDSNDGDNNDDNGSGGSSGISSYEEPDPEPEPDDNCDRDKHSGKGHGNKKGKGHRGK